MAFKPFGMGYNREDLAGKPPVPPNWYTLRFITFKPRVSKDKESYNLNAEFSIVGGEYDGRRVFAGMNSKPQAGFITYAIIHGLGTDLEVILDGTEGTEAESKAIPGTFEHVDEHPDDPSQWGKYIGPLTNKTMDAELAITEYQGRQRNEIRQVRCAVAGCTDRHPTNMIQSKPE